MATCGHTPVTFFDICDNSIYFKVESDTEVDGDAFNKSEPISASYWLRSKDNKFLLLKEKEFLAENLDDTQQHQPGCKFGIQPYNELPEREGKGRAAILYIRKEEKMMVLCCNEHDISLKEMEVLPSSISEATNEAVFYMIQQTPSRTFRFLFSKDQSKCLGFADVTEPSIKKLVLCPNNALDSSCDIIRERVPK